MSRQTRWLLIGLCVGLLAVPVAVAFWLMLPISPPNDPPGLLDLKGCVPDPTPEPNGARFESVVQGYGFDKKTRGKFCDEVFRARDGTKLSRDNHWYRSSQEARTAFKQKLRGAMKAIDSVALCNGRGEVVGRRAVLLLKSTAQTGQTACAVHWSGRTLVTTSSESLEQLLAFERETKDPDELPCAEIE